MLRVTLAHADESAEQGGRHLEYRESTRPSVGTPGQLDRSEIGTAVDEFRHLPRLAASVPRWRTSSRATSSIRSSWPPTVLRRPISTRMSREETPYCCAARCANNRKEE